MSTIEELMKNIEQFEHNIKEIGTVLEIIKQISQGYEESINAPRRVIAKLDETVAYQSKEFDKLVGNLEDLTLMIKEYDSLIENSVAANIEKKLQRINETNIAILNEMQNSISRYDDIMRKSESSLSEKKADLITFQADLQSNLNAYGDRLDRSKEALVNEMGVHARMINEFSSSFNNSASMFIDLHNKFNMTETAIINLIDKSANVEKGIAKVEEKTDVIDVLHSLLLNISSLINNYESVLEKLNAKVNLLDEKVNQVLVQNEAIQSFIQKVDTKLSSIDDKLEQNSRMIISSRYILGFLILIIGIVVIIK